MNQLATLAFKDTDASPYQSLFLAQKGMLEAVGTHVTHMQELLGAGNHAASIAAVDKKRGRSLVKNVRASYGKMEASEAVLGVKQLEIQQELSQQLSGGCAWATGLATLLDLDLAKACKVAEQRIFIECVKLHVLETIASLKSIVTNMLRDMKGVQQGGENYWRGAVEDSATLDELLDAAVMLKPGALKAMALSQSVTKITEARTSRE